jgi:hypothetical protein
MKTYRYQEQKLQACKWVHQEWVQIFWNNAPNGLRITDQRGFLREEHLLESHREHGFIIPEGYKPLAGGEAVGRHPWKAEGNEPTPEGSQLHQSRYLGSYSTPARSKSSTNSSRNDFNR